MASAPLPRALAAEATTPKIVLAPTTALGNQTVTITGTNFSTSGKATIKSITIGGTAVSTDKISGGSSVAVDSAGQFFTTLLVPVTSPYLASGSQTVLVTDTGGKSASATLTIPKPTLTLSPTTSRAGTAVTATGTNYPVASQRLGADDPATVRIEYKLPDSSVKRVATVVPDTEGKISVSFMVPKDAPAGSKDNLVTSTIAGTTTKIEAKHSVDAAVLTLTPSTAAPDAEISISGSKLKPYAAVGWLWLGNLKLRPTSTVHTDADGAFPAKFVVPVLEDGLYGFTADVGGDRYSAGFTVVDSGIKLSGAPPATADPPRSLDLVRTLRPMEDSLVRVFYFDRQQRRWSFYDPRPILAKNVNLENLVEGKIYWVEVKSDLQLVLDGKMRNFYRGWNLIAW
jgi:hypothetical protein